MFDPDVLDDLIAYAQLERIDAHAARIGAALFATAKPDPKSAALEHIATLTRTALGAAPDEVTFPLDALEKAARDVLASLPDGA